MKKGYTDLTFVLDRSGSMVATQNEVIGGFNRMVKDQVDEYGECKVSLIQFDDVYQTDYIAVSANQVKELDRTTYQPRGWTALYDAVGKTIVAMGERFAGMKEKDRPEKVTLIIMTDGAENSSKEWSASMLKPIIEEQQNKYSWEIVFIGANQDAILTGQSFGIKTSNSLTYDTNNTHAVFDLLSSKTKLYRASSASMAMTDDDRNRVI